MREMTQLKVIFVVGANASGKSDFAIELALALGGEVISADSRQVFRGLDAGSGKVPHQDRRDVLHHLIDVVDPGSLYSVYDFQRQSLSAIQDIVGRGRVPIVAGGTGLYVDALAKGYSLVHVPANAELRKELATLTREELLRMVQTLEPDALQLLRPLDHRRIVRAIEIIRAGVSYLETRKSTALVAPFFVGIRWERERLRERIHSRLEERVDGMVHEVRELIQDGVPWQFFWDLGLEYRFTARHLVGELSRQEFVSGLEVAIGQFAKRQMTWFRRNRSIQWIDGEDIIATGGQGMRDILPEVCHFLNLTVSCD